jgi:hypothetical protein
MLILFMVVVMVGCFVGGYFFGGVRVYREWNASLSEEVKAMTNLRCKEEGCEETIAYEPTPVFGSKETYRPSEGRQIAYLTCPKNHTNPYVVWHPPREHQRNKR